MFQAATSLSTNATALSALCRLLPKPGTKTYPSERGDGRQMWGWAPERQVTKEQTLMIPRQNIATGAYRRYTDGNRED